MEAYFSNFIEGTEFAIGEAVEIVFEGRIPENRPADGHDVLGTYLQLVELGQRSAIATDADTRSEEHTSELQSLMRISYAVFCLKKKKNTSYTTHKTHDNCKHIYSKTTNRVHTTIAHK